MFQSLSLERARIILSFDNWPAILFSRLFDRRTSFVAYRKNGLDILVDHSGGDQNGTVLCIATDMYSRYVPLLSLDGPARVLDIGANGGGFPLMLKLAGVKLAQVVSVEMNPLTCERLRVNLSTNLGGSAVAVNAAVCGAGAAHDVLLETSRGSTGQSIYQSHAGPDSGHVSVATVTLRQLFDRHFKDGYVDLCKVDIEGAEYEVFQSAPDETIAGIGHLIIEFHDRSRTPAFVERIASLGFAEIGRSADTGEHTEVRAFRGPAATAASAARAAVESS